MSGRRRPIAAANWKMNLLRADARAWCRAVHENLDAAPAASDVVVFPGFLLITEAAAALAGAPVEIGGQDVHPDV